MKTIYISGSISDPTTGLPRDGWQKDFLDAEERLRKMGYQVLTPIDISKEAEDEWSQQWRLTGEFANWNGLISNAISRHPTRGTYIVACLQAMNTEAMARRLDGVYVIGSERDPYSKQRVYYSDGVQMELHMARVLGIPIFAEFYDGNEIDIHLLPVKDGKRLLDNGEFGHENWSELL